VGIEGDLERQYVLNHSVCNIVKPDGTSAKTFDSGTGGTGFKP